MEKLIVCSDSTYANGVSASADLNVSNAITGLANGALAFYTDSGALFKHGDSLTNAVKHIKVFLGNTYGAMFMGNIYPREYKYSLSAYTAPAAKVMSIGNHTAGGTTYGLNLPTTLVVGTIGRIQIVDLNKRFDDLTRYHNYEQIVRTGDTATTFMTALLAKITNDTNKCVASVASILTSAVCVGVLVTGNVGTNFAINCSGILENADVLKYKEIIVAKTAGITKGYSAGLTSPLVEYNEGTGTYTQMLALEKATNPTLGSQGLTTERGNDIFSLPSRLSNTTWTLQMMSCKVPNEEQLIGQDNFTNIFTFATVSTVTTGGTSPYDLIVDLNTQMIALSSNS